MFLQAFQAALHTMASVLLLLLSKPNSSAVASTAEQRDVA
jgi:hypothetical protein